jgi:hypothetical protein
MLKTNKIIIAILIVGLIFWLTPFGGKLCFADPTGGVAPDYHEVKHRVIHRPYLDIEVWVDKGEGAVYHPGDEIKVYFRASSDCYVVLYNIDARGYVHLLYPLDEWDDPYVEGGRVYRIPDRFDDYDLTINGPGGVEYIQAVASLEPLDLPNFPGEYIYEGEVYAYCLDGEDPFEFMEAVNAEIAPFDYASDVCIFSVEYPHPKWYYWPKVVYVDRPVDVFWGGVYFDYPWGVEVWIDGIFYGITPITIPALVVGRHYVSFWYRGCWIWRDWCHIRRDRVITIWPDCHRRYRYVRERFVEKSYRTEKAKRRRGIGGESGGLVEPVKLVEKGRMAKAEPDRIRKDKGFKREITAKPRRIENRTLKTNITVKHKPRKIDKTIRTKTGRRPSSVSEKASPINVKNKARLKAVQVRDKNRKPARIEKQIKSVRPKKPAKAIPQTEIKKSGDSKPKASSMKSASGRSRTKSPTAAKRATSGKSKTSKPAKRRR